MSHKKNKPKTYSYLDSDKTSILLTPRAGNIYFKAKGLQPGSLTEIRFNNVDVSEFCIKPDVIQVQIENKAGKTWNEAKVLQSLFYGGYKKNKSGFIKIERLDNKSMASGTVMHAELISYNPATKTGVANVYCFITDQGRDVPFQHLGNTRVQLSSNIADPRSGSSRIEVDYKKGGGDEITCNVISFFPGFSSVNVSTSNTIQVSGKIVNTPLANANSPHYIVGKDIYIVSGDGAYQNATVASYNTETRVITIDGEWDVIPGSIAANGTGTGARSVVRFGELETDSYGTQCGILAFPALKDSDVVEPLFGWQYHGKVRRFNRSFKNFTTANKIEFLSVDSNTSIGVPTEDPVDPEPKPTGNSVGTLTPVVTQGFSSTPFAQTFYVDDKIYPQGLFLTSVKLLFREKDEQYPVQVQIRPTTSSIPDPSLVVPNGNAYITPFDINTISDTQLQQINISETNPFSNSEYYSVATFTNPVYLEPAKEYALVVMTPSPKYQIYLAQIGQKLVGTDRTISSQPYTGVLYKSQGTSEWTASPNEDLCFELTKAVFDTTNPGIIELNLLSLPENIGGQPGVDNYDLGDVVSLENTAPTENVNVHTFFVDSSETIFANTSVKYEFKTTRTSGVMDDYKTLELDTTYEIDDNYGTRVLTPTNTSFMLKATIATTNPDISPIMNFDAINLMRIENIIDNCTIANSDIFVVNPGQDYQNAAQVSVTITGGGGTGATAVANVVNGQVDKIFIVNGGSGYITSPNVVITRDSTATINATAVVNGDDQPNGGISNSKYITRKFSMADGFNGGDLRVLFNAYKPRECEIEVYYKVLSEDDADSFDNKRWTLMTLIGGINAYSLNEKDHKNYIYAPGTNNIALNQIEYDGFTTFKYFAIKLVMRSTDTSKIPKITDFRVTALAELLT